MRVRRRRRRGRWHRRRVLAHWAARLLTRRFALKALAWGVRFTVRSTLYAFRLALRASFRRRLRLG